MLKPIEIKLNDQTTVKVIRFDFQFIATGVLEGSEETIFKYRTEDITQKSGKTYGDYRPIQIIPPVFEEGFEYSVFLDLRRIHQDCTVNDVGLLLFCSKNNLNCQYFEKIIKKYPNWENSRTYNLIDDY